MRLAILVLISVEFGLNCREIHRLLNDLEICRDLQGNGVNGRHEVLIRLPVSGLFDLGQNLLTEPEFQLVFLLSGSHTANVMVSGRFDRALRTAIQGGRVAADRGHAFWI